MDSKEKLEQIKTICMKEIEWAQENISVMYESEMYHKDDKIWFPSWLEAHNRILKIVNS